MRNSTQSSATADSTLVSDCLLFLKDRVCKFFMPALAFLLVTQVSSAQPWTYDFGTGTGSNASASSGSTTFFSTNTAATPTNGGTYRIRTGSTPGTGFVLANPGTSLGAGTELQIAGAATTSTNKFTIYGWNAPSTVAYVKYNLRTTSSGNGNLAIQVGNGVTTGTDNNNYTGGYNGAVVSLNIAYTSGAISSVVRRAGGSNTTITGSGFAKDTDQAIEIYVNNGTTSTTYGRSGVNTLTAGTWDLWVNGTKVSASPYATAGLTTGNNISGIGFFSESSTGNAASMILDNIEYSNSLPPAVTTYTVTYDGNTNTGGTAPVDGSSPYTAGSDVTVLGVGTLVKTGYTFTGWNTAADGSGTPYASGGTITAIAANTTLYAQWTINTYTVTYDGNTNDGGTAPVDPNSPYDYNTNATVLSEGTLTKTGFTFAGWNTQADGSGTAYNTGGTILNIAANITLFAQWIPANSYAVLYDGNGNTGGTAPVDPNSPYTGGSNVTILSEGSLVRTGYTFTGWNTAANGSGTAYAVNDVITNISASVSLFAQWTINTYTVTYDGNTNDGGTAPVDPNSPYNYNSNVTVLGQGTLTKTNYNFTGWNTASDGSGTAYADGGTITGIAANITLYAQWSIITYTVTYNGNTNTGGTAPVDPNSPYDIGSNVTVLGQGTLVKTGNTFAGWNTAADGSGTAYAEAGTITNLSANTTLFAQWTVNTYTVTYDGNGNTGGTAPVDANSPYNFGSTVTVLANTGNLVRTGFTFAGWNTAANGSGTSYAATGAVTFTLGAANVVLYARWAQPLYEPVDYTVASTIGGTTNGTSNNNWTTHSGSGSISVTSGSLNYTGLQASTGNKMRLPGANGTTSADVNRPTTVAGTVGYYSFLLNVADNTQLAAGGDYFAGFGGTAGTSVTALYARLQIKSANAGANYRLGITNSSGGTPTITDFATDLSFGTTYLVVVKHDFNGASNDISTLWVNPSSLGGAEPGGGVTNNSATIGQTNFASIFLRNGSNTPKADIDEVRVGSTWADVTPPGTFTITATAQTTGGSISPAGAVVVNPGSNQTFTITPDVCNDIAEVIVDGVTSLGAVTEYTFENVSANHTIDVYFNPSTSTTWTGTVNSNWDEAGNWSSCVPNAGLEVTIAAGTPNAPVLNVDAEVNSLTINDGATLSLSDKTLTINGGFTGSALSTLTGSDAASLVLNSTTSLISSAPIRLKNLVINGGTTTLSSAVEISGGTATVDPGEVSVLSGALLESNGFLTIKSNSFGTGRVAQGDDAGNYITGDVTVERFIPNNGFRSWRFLSVPTTGTQTIRQAWQEGAANPSPLQNNLPGYGTTITGTGSLATAQAAGFDGVVPNASFLTWGTNAWVNSTGTNGPIATTKGYMLFLRGDRAQVINGAVTATSSTTLRTTGGLYQGTQALPAFAPNSFNAVGNLYASAIDFTQLQRTGGTQNLFYIWDSKKQSGTSLGAYQTFSATNGFACLVSGGSYVFGQPNTKIESGQAFFVSATTAGTLTLTEASKVADGASLGFRPATPASALVKLDSRLYAAGSTEIADANVVVFNDKYSNTVAEEDAVKMTNMVENFGVQQGDKTLAIEGRHTVTAADEIVFNMWNLKQQQYAVEFVPQNLQTAGLEATLEDSYLKTKTPVSLETNTVVNFTVDANPASAAANRFKIVLNKVKQPVPAKAVYTIAPNPVENGIVNLQFSNKAAGKYSIRILTTAGQPVITRTMVHAGGSAVQTISLGGKAASGNYMVEITAPDKTKTIQSLLVK